MVMLELVHAINDVIIIISSYTLSCNEFVLELVTLEKKKKVSCSAYDLR